MVSMYLQSGPSLHMNSATLDGRQYTNHVISQEAFASQKVHLPLICLSKKESGKNLRGFHICLPSCLCTRSIFIVSLSLSTCTE